MLSSNRISLPRQERKAISCCQLRGKRSSLLSREVGGACLLGGSFQSLLVKDGVEDFSVWKLGELCALLL